jgi:hypothetical protein
MRFSATGMMNDTEKATPSADINSQKLLLFAALGYLQCLKAGACHEDEVYRVIGQPRILQALRKAGISESFANVINGLDEPGWVRHSLGEAWFEKAVDELAQECMRLLRELGPPEPGTPPPTLKLFSNAD